MDLIRDVLDNQLVDREAQKMGRVDGIVAEVRDTQPPLLTWVEVGGPTLVWRLTPKLGGWTDKLASKLGPAAEPYRIPWNKLRHEGINVVADVDVHETEIGVLERWLRKHIIDRIPGAG